MPAIIGHGAVCGVAGVAARAAVAEKKTFPLPPLLGHIATQRILTCDLSLAK